MRINGSIKNLFAKTNCIYFNIEKESRLFDQKRNVMDSTMNPTIMQNISIKTRTTLDWVVKQIESLQAVLFTFSVFSLFSDIFYAIKYDPHKSLNNSHCPHNRNAGVREFVFYISSTNHIQIFINIKYKRQKKLLKKVIDALKYTPK